MHGLANFKTESNNSYNLVPNYQTTHRHIPEDSNRTTDYDVDLKSHKGCEI
jgi:hypothetical protein